LREHKFTYLLLKLKVKN